MKKFSPDVLTSIFLASLILLLPFTAHAEGEWGKKISLGYNQSSGNTDKAELAIAGSVDKDFTNSTLLSKFDIFY